MSLMLVIRRRDDSTVPISSSDLLLEGLEILDATADQAGLQGPSDYADPREIPEDFDGDAADLEALLGANEVWHDTETAATNFEALADALGTGDAAALSEAVRTVATLLRENPGEFQLDVTE